MPLVYQQCSIGYNQPMDIGLLSLLFFGSFAAWMYFTPPRFREVVFG
jgi:hypothetical protein